MKRLASILLYLAYLLAAVALVFYLVFWRPWVEQKRITNAPESNDLPAIRHVQPATLQRVGSLLTGKDSSFIHFDHEKPAGKIRVCAIGDSFVYGDEIGVSLDYPTQLGKLFKEHGYHNVEVINYGSSWHGFHQAYIIWDEIAKPMGCDFVLTGPSSFHHDRDSELNHTDDAFPYYLHSIFALDKTGNDVIRLDVTGSTQEERFDDYYRFIPDYERLRYENVPAPIVRSVLPPGKTMRNPLYYHPGNLQPPELIAKTWDILLQKIASQSMQVIVTSQHEFIATTGSRFNLTNYASVQVADYNFFPNRAPNKHTSGTGNQRIATIFFNLLTNDNHRQYPTVLVRDLASKPNTASPQLGWGQIKTLELATANQAVGHFIYIDHRMHTPLALPATDQTSMLAIHAPDSSMVDGLFMMLEEPVATSSQLILEDSAGQQIELGNLYSRTTSFPLHESTVEGFSLGYWDNPTLDLDLVEQSTGIRPSGRISIFADGHLVLRGEVTPHDASVTLLPAEGTALLRAVADGESYIDWRKAPETLYLQVRSNDDTLYREKFATTSIFKREMPNVHGSIAHVICTSASGGAIATATECHR